MKILLLFLLFVSSVGSISGANRKVLFAIIDGIPADCIERLQPPTLMQIAKEGGYCRSYAGGVVGTYSQTPTISAIGYSNIITGTWMNKHQVKGNDDIHPNYNYPTIFRVAKDQPQKFSTAIYSSWTDNRTVLLGEGLEPTRHLSIDYVYDGYDRDKVRFPPKQFDKHIQDIDAQVCRDAATCIAQHGPDLNWLYLWYTDDAFHNNGNGKVTDEAVLEVDRQIAQVWKSVKQREKEFGEDWLVIFTTDHGRDERGFNHGGQSERERTTWIVINLRKTNSHFSEKQLSQVDIFPTICRFMNWTVDENTRMELDGQPFIGKIDMEDLTLSPYDNSVELLWKPLKHSGQAQVYLSVTNNRFKGGSDRWIKIGDVPVGSGRFKVDLSAYPDSKIYKFAVVSPWSTLGKWYIK